jgi:hypothetical protein
MKNIFSGLISCGLLLAAAQTNGQSLFAYPENNNIILRWSAANEQFIDRYVIEHSADGIYFTPLHELVSKGPYTDNIDNEYTDADLYPRSFTNYYRLHTILKDGESFYSPVIEVFRDAPDRPVIHPSVVHAGATIWLDYYHSQPVTVNMFNARGTLVGSWLVNNTTFNINTDRLPKGILFYRISDERHPLLGSGKLMIQ